MRALDPALRLGDEGLSAGQTVAVGGLELRVVPTPGHTHDSLSFHLPADRAVLTGDTVLGRGTTVVAHPDGRLGDYLDSLRRLRSLTVDDGVRTVLPGHGPVLDDAQGAVEYYSPTGPTGWPRSRRPWRTASRPRRRSWPGCTPTWTGRCGRRPSCRCGRNWSTSRTTA